MDNSFLVFTTPEILSKIDIDSRLEESFKRVMNTIQEYFNANGYSSSRNYKEYLEKYFLNSGKDNLRIYVNKIEDERVGGFYNKAKCEICINVNKLSGQQINLDSTLCHEFIHFLVEQGLVYGKADPDILHGGFINESLTEMLTQQMYPNSNAYDAQVAMQKFANMVSGKQNNFQRFLEGFVDSRYSSHDWENYRLSVNNFQKDFDEKGYITLKGAEKNKNFVEAQQRLISLFLRPNDSKTIEEYIDAINMLIDRPVNDKEYINGTVVANMDHKIIADMKLNKDELNKFLEQKLVELRQQISELRNTIGYEFEFAGRKIQIDENYRVYGSLIGLSRQWDPKTGIMNFSYNKEKLEIDTNKINFHQKEEQTMQRISELSSYFSKTSSKDLNMISSAKSLGEGLTKIEKFDLPTLGEKGSRIIYVATYNSKIVILNNVHQLSNISDIDLDDFIGMTSKNLSVAAIYSNKIGKIQKGLSFSILSDKQIQSKAISLYAAELMSKMSEKDIENAIFAYKQSEEFNEDFEEEVKEDAIRAFAKKQFTLLPEQSKTYLDKVIGDNPQFVVSSKDGKTEISALFGDKYKTAFAGKSEVLFDSKGKGLYNEVISSLSNTETKLNGIDLLINSDGELIIEEEMKAEFDKDYEIFIAKELSPAKQEQKSNPIQQNNNQSEQATNQKKSTDEEIVDLKNESWRKNAMEKLGVDNDFNLGALLEQQKLIERQRQEIENIESVEQTSHRIR